MKLLIEMTLLADAVFGNGLSIPGGEDIATQMDDQGFPYLKGNTLKGMFREELINLLGWTGKDEKETDETVCTLMGEGGSEQLDETRKVRFSDLVINPELRKTVEEETDDLARTYRHVYLYPRFHKPRGWNGEGRIIASVPYSKERTPFLRNLLLCERGRRIGKRGTFPDQMGRHHEKPWIRKGKHRRGGTV